MTDEKKARADAAGGAGEVRRATATPYGTPADAQARRDLRASLALATLRAADWLRRRLPPLAAIADIFEAAAERTALEVEAAERAEAAAFHAAQTPDQRTN